MEAILQRMGEGVRVIILGDPFQLDRKEEDLTYGWNGLVFALHALSEQSFMAHVHLTGHHRSRTAEVMRRLARSA